MNLFYKISKANAELIGVFEYASSCHFTPFVNEQVDGAFLVSENMYMLLKDTAPFLKVDFSTIEKIKASESDPKSKFSIPPLTPNWYKLEQDLRYSTLFAKAFQYASDKGFNLFTVTLINGKNGEASENSLSFAFSVLGVDWSNEEKSKLNKILSQNNFTITI